jgi:hypothetical protein
MDTLFGTETGFKALDYDERVDGIDPGHKHGRIELGCRSHVGHTERTATGVTQPNRQLIVEQNMDLLKRLRDPPLHSAPNLSPCVNFALVADSTPLPTLARHDGNSCR